MDDVERDGDDEEEVRRAAVVGIERCGRLKRQQ